MAGTRKSSRSRAGGSGKVRSIPRGSASSPASDAAPPQDPGLTTNGSTGTAAPRSRFSRRNIFIGLGIFALVLIAGLALFAWWNVNKPLAQIDGTARLEGLTANVQVTRDTNGIPHIIADNVNDMYMAQGYVHAQDRLYQMFFFRTLGRGRLAELFQPTLTDADKFLRTLGFARVAEAEYAQLDSGAKAALENYARGVNAFVHAHKDSLPIEFTLLGVGFEDWTPADSLIFGKIQALDLTDSWANELLASDMIQAVGEETARRLLPGLPASTQQSGSSNGGRSYEGDVIAFLSTLRPLEGGFGEGLGSNNWAVAGSKSATGNALLANDPHLGVRNPSIWYQIHLSTRDGAQDVAGFSFAGVPGVITGHNKKIAWGVTNLGADVMDVYLEQLDPAQHPGQYRSAGGWKPLTIYTETIKVRDSEPITELVRLTEHGPLISDALPITPAVSTTVSGTYSIRWTALEPGRVFEAAYGLQTASNWDEFRAAVSKWDVPGQNFVYADTSGNIGYQATGKIPVRSSGAGALPVQGWTGDGEWTGYIPFDQMPSKYNPPEGYVASANNPPFGEGAAVTFPGYFAQPWRIDRIRQVLTSKDKLSLDDLQALQLDVLSGLATKVLPFLTAAQPSDDAAKQAVERLKGWDGRMTADSVPAAIYEVTYNTVLSRTLGDDLDRNLYLQYVDARPGDALGALAGLLDKPDDPLWDRKDTGDKVEKRDDILSDSLTRATAELNALLGASIDGWTWGKVHMITPHHEFSDATLVGGMFQMPSQPLGGDMTTVAVAGYPLIASAFPLQQPYPINLHQSYRMLLDAGNWSNSKAIFLTGESGQPGSPFRDNMYQPWIDGKYLPMLYTREEVDAAKRGVLTLTP